MSQSLDDSSPSDTAITQILPTDLANMVTAYKSSIWTIQLTRFTDDYKPRGGDWSSADKPVSFATEKKARSYLRQKLIIEIEDSNCGERPTLLDEYFTEDGNFKPAYRKNMAVIEDVLGQLVCGEYVSRRLVWTISESKLSDDDVMSSDEEAEEEEEEEEEAVATVDNDASLPKRKHDSDNEDDPKRAKASEDT